MFLAHTIPKCRRFHFVVTRIRTHLPLDASVVAVVVCRLELAFWTILALAWRGGVSTFKKCTHSTHCLIFALVVVVKPFTLSSPISKVGAPIIVTFRAHVVIGSIELPRRLITQI
jgi:hypothetical protein